MKKKRIDEEGNKQRTKHNRRRIHSEKKHSCYRNVKRFYVENESNPIATGKWQMYIHFIFSRCFGRPIVCTAHTKHCEFFMRIFTFPFNGKKANGKRINVLVSLALAWLPIDEKSVYSLNCTMKSCLFVFHLPFGVALDPWPLVVCSVCMAERLFFHSFFFFLSRIFFVFSRFLHIVKR